MISSNDWSTMISTQDTLLMKQREVFKEHNHIFWKRKKSGFWSHLLKKYSKSSQFCLSWFHQLTSLVTYMGNSKISCTILIVGVILQKQTTYSLVIMLIEAILVLRLYAFSWLSRSSTLKTFSCWEEIMSVSQSTGLMAFTIHAKGFTRSNYGINSLNFSTFCRSQQ